MSSPEVVRLHDDPSTRRLNRRPVTREGHTMSRVVHPVNGEFLSDPGHPARDDAESVLKSELTLSAEPARAQPSDVSAAEPAFPLLDPERDPPIETEAELRLAWGDR